MSEGDLAYEGETSHRNRRAAMALAFVCPGIAYMYVGKLLRGVTANLLLVSLVVGFVVAQAVLKFFPLLPTVVLALCWLLFCGMVARDVASTIDGLREERDGDYVLRPYNHWMLYTAVFLLSFLVPVVASVQLSAHYLWSATYMEDAAMYPTLLPGDTLLVDRSALSDRAPRRGEIVASTPDADAEYDILRVVGVPGDEISVEGSTVYINDRPMPQNLFKPDGGLPDLDGGGDFFAMIEKAGNARYIISMSRRAFAGLSGGAEKLDEHQYFLLSDNRSQVPVESEQAKIRDSRDFGPVRQTEIHGRPLYIAWSTDPDTGAVRWERIGLRVQ